MISCDHCGNPGELADSWEKPSSIKYFRVSFHSLYDNGSTCHNLCGTRLMRLCHECGNKLTDLLKKVVDPFLNPPADYRSHFQKELDDRITR